ncbi:hypothetical protein CMV_008693 [Castanea mollissima]|uniref:Uncharacterized protein n=1 Tax=Castanea mollissima TaxID=60419 RepID=A0A8J4RJA3_9ROSI|nr:hypothetical protein CMV_008693 [Castanea mollissima]
MSKLESRLGRGVENLSWKSDRKRCSKKTSPSTFTENVYDCYKLMTFRGAIRVPELLNMINALLFLYNAFCLGYNATGNS